jgi:hypothetical protein
MDRNLPQKVPNTRLVKKRSTFCGTWEFAILFTQAYHRPPLQRTHPSMKHCVTFNIMPLSYAKREIFLCPTSIQENNPLLTVQNCLFNIFTVKLQTWSTYPTYTHQGHAIPLQKKYHLLRKHSVH